MEFIPAISAERMRTPAEMVEYYHNDIDIYVDMSKSAGRQNGLIEAGSCGLPIIASKCGISEQLIENRVNGFLVDRNINSLKPALLSTLINYIALSDKIYNTIQDKWSWKVHAKLFEKAFGRNLL